MIGGIRGSDREEIQMQFVIHSLHAVLILPVSLMKYFTPKNVKYTWNVVFIVEMKYTLSFFSRLLQ